MREETCDKGGQRMLVKKIGFKAKKTNSRTHRYPFQERACDPWWL